MFLFVFTAGQQDQNGKTSASLTSLMPKIQISPTGMRRTYFFMRWLPATATATPGKQEFRAKKSSGQRKTPRKEKLRAKRIIEKNNAQREDRKRQREEKAGK